MGAVTLILVDCKGTETRIKILNRDAPLSTIPALLLDHLLNGQSTLLICNGRRVHPFTDTVASLLGKATNKQRLLYLDICQNT